MFYWLSLLSDIWSGFNVFRYITFRAMASLLTSFSICFIFGPFIIAQLQKMQRRSGGQPIRHDGPETHYIKSGTPTMGGIMICLAFGVSVFLWGNWHNPWVCILTFVTFAYAFIGFLDDALKIYRKNSQGLSGKLKVVLQSCTACAGIIWVIMTTPHSVQTAIFIPFLKNTLFILPFFVFILWAIFVVVGTSNAVNLTDGLDGLAVGPVVIASGVLGAMSYVLGHSVLARYLYVIHLPYAGELLVLVAAMIGACLGFLWYNSPPADVFMGDTGSLALGGFLGMLAIMIKREVIFAIIGGVFVMEALSVMMQVFYYKRTRKRIFLMAPFHHHFEKKGWSESTIVFRFWIIALLLGLIGLMDFKLR